MIDIPQDLKDLLKQQRLDQYRATIYNLMMDLTAYEAVNDAEMVAATQKRITDWETAYQAVEGMS